MKKRSVYAWREIKENNFSPMIVNSSLWKDFKCNNIQVLVNSFGGQQWINISRHEFLYNYGFTTLDEEEIQQCLKLAIESLRQIMKSSPLNLSFPA